jgi:hypothetical protein
MQKPSLPLTYAALLPFELFKMTSRKELCHAVIFHSESEATEPLIEQEHEHHQLEEKVFSSFKFSALALGFLVGFFIQCSTLGANFLAITIWGEDMITMPKRIILAFSLLWSLFTSTVAIVILGLLRNLISITYHAIRLNSEELLEEMVLHVECSFVVGTLVGVCLAWTTTDIVLGMQAQILYSLVTLGIALLWCQVMLKCFRPETKLTEPLLIV